MLTHRPFSDTRGFSHRFDNVSGDMPYVLARNVALTQVINPHLRDSDLQEPYSVLIKHHLESVADMQADNFKKFHNKWISLQEERMEIRSKYRGLMLIHNEWPSAVNMEYHAEGNVEVFNSNLRMSHMEEDIAYLLLDFVEIFNIQFWHDHGSYGQVSWDLSSDQIEFSHNKYILDTEESSESF